MTQPGQTANVNTPAVVIQATYKDPVTGALYVHTDLEFAQEPWAEEAHIAPFTADEDFGDVESWAAYVKRFDNGHSLLTWSSDGLKAVLDYGPDQRGQIVATMPFVKSPEFKAWMALADGHAKGQREAIEALEDRGADIVDPDPATLMNLLRSLRTSVGSKADTTLNPDGTTAVIFERVTTVRAGGNSNLDLPSLITIAVPILKGHDTRYKMAVRVRAAPDSNAHLMLRFSIPEAERALELVYADRVLAATTLLGDGHTVLRGAG